MTLENLKATYERLKAIGHKRAETYKTLIKWREEALGIAPEPEKETSKKSK